MTKVDNFPRIAQLGLQVYDSNEDLMYEYSCLVKPDESNWTIPKEKFFIDHNMSTERCIAEGITIQSAMTFILDMIRESDFIIAHNIGFDYPVIGAEMIRLGLKTDKKTTKICTMKQSTVFCKLPGNYGFKFPKLEELYFILFNEKISDAHDALGDVKSCARCFFELKKRGIIK